MRRYIFSLLINLFLLFASGFIVAQTTGCDLLKKLNDDLDVKGNELRPFFENPANVGGKRIKAWEALIDLPLLRTNVTKLQAVSNFAVAQNIDPSIIKTELQSLPNVHKEELVKSMEVANGSLPYPVIQNTLPPSSNGELYGSFINGQFVPTSNTPAGGTWDFVIKTNGEIKVGTKHSWLAGNGEDVLAAGEIKINGGVIEEITNASGHYVPTVGQGMNYLRLFKDKGVDISSAHLYLGKWEGGVYIDVKNVHPFSQFRIIYE